MEPAVLFRGAVSLLGRFPALAGIDLEVQPGEIVLLRGPNGAGKTTLLRCCAGLLPITSGTARVLGHDLTVDRNAVRRRVGLLGHATGLYDELTVADNVDFWARAGGADRADALAAMEQMGLSGRLADVPVARLSAGQRRRTSLAVMLARRPEVWLLDEPHAGLDQDGRDLVDGLIAAGSEAGVTVLIASHELDRAEAVAQRTVTIAGGMVVSDSAGNAVAVPDAADAVAVPDGADAVPHAEPDGVHAVPDAADAVPDPAVPDAADAVPDAVGGSGEPESAGGNVR